MTDHINALAAGWCAWMLPMLWQMGLLAGLIWAADLVLQRRGWPQVRYALWLLVLARLLIPPSFALPTSLSARLLGPGGKQLAAVQPKATTFDGAPAVTVTLPAASFPATPSSIPHATLSFESRVMLGATAVSLFFLGWLLARFLRLRRQVCRASDTAVPAHVAEEFAQHAAQLHLRRPPRLVLTKSVPSAGVCGIFRPVLLLPESYCKLPPEQLGHIFMHEFAHLKRGDLIVNAIQSLLHIIYWFNPALWLASRRLRHLREVCCDATVANLLRERTREYGLTLLSAAARRSQDKFQAELGLLGLFENPALLSRRIEYLAQPAWKHRRLRWIVSLLTAALVTLCIMPMAALKAAPATEANPPVKAVTDINAKVAKLDIEKAKREDVVAVFGEPASYVWGDKTFTKDNLPNAYIMVYPGALRVEMVGGQAEELRFEAKSDYVFGGGLQVGSSLEEALKVIGPPDKTVEGGEIGFEDGVLYKNSSGKNDGGENYSGVDYYARRRRGMRIFLQNHVVSAIYVTRKGQSLFEMPAGKPMSDLNAKVARLDIEKATRDDVIAVFGEPASYAWGNKTFSKDNLPNTYVMLYFRGFTVEMTGGHVEELRFGESGPSDYVFGNGLRVGSSLEEALKVIGPPDKTVEGGEIGFEDGVLYKNAHFTSGDGRSQTASYYARRSKGVRIFLFGDKVAALYVTRKSQINPWTEEQKKNRIVDRTDYPFVDDPAMVGKWVSVDFVKNIEDFRPGKKQCSSSLYLTDLNFQQGGQIVRTFTRGAKKDVDSSNTWTKGLVLSKEGQTASAYTIKTLGGKNYLFYEWKNGDYVYGHMKPQFYVLAQAGAGN